MCSFMIKNTARWRITEKFLSSISKASLQKIILNEIFKLYSQKFFISLHRSE